MTKRTYLLQCLTLAALLFTATAWGRPGWSEPLPVPQPDGTSVTLLMHGDEFLSYMTTTDGYTVKKGDDGFYYYAARQDGQLVPTSVVARNAADRTQSDADFLKGVERHIRPDMTPSEIQLKENARLLYGADRWQAGGQRGAHAPAKLFGGRIDYSNFHGLVILVEFNDRKFLRDDAKAFYQDLTSKKDMEGYYDATGEKYTNIDGSVRDYFYDNSLGMFDPTFDVVGPVQIDYATTDPKKDKNINAILKAALAAANEEVNYRIYDLDSNGSVDMVYFIFAGYGSYVQGNNENYIWPHAGDLSWYSRYQGLRYDGMNFSRYACSVEIADQESQADQHQKLDGIGTMCHEFSHVLGLADHYDTDYAQNGESEHPSRWDIMASGSDYNNGLTPCGYNAYERYTLGFAPLMELGVAGKYTLEPFITSNQYYRIATGTNKEHFYIENRQKTGWDRFLPGHGLLVWRVDSTNYKVWDQNTVNADPDHMYYELLKAVPGKTIASESTPFPGTGKIIDLTSYTAPALLTWAGREADLDLYDIMEEGENITFNAGKNVYQHYCEDFEHMAFTNADADDQQGVFTSWSLTNALVASVNVEGTGNGQRVGKLLRSATLTTAPLEKPIRTMNFKVWAGDEAVKIALRENSSGSWRFINNSEGQRQLSMKKNTEATLSYTIEGYQPEGSQLQIQMLATSANAVAYVDDITITYGDATVGIEQATVRPADNGGNVYNLQGQRVSANGYRGIVVREGRKTVVR